MQEIVQLDGNRRDRVIAETYRLIFYGFVRWKDYLGEDRETRFCIRALPHYQGPGKWCVFVLDADTPEAYTRRT